MNMRAVCRRSRRDEFRGRRQRGEARGLEGARMMAGRAGAGVCWRRADVQTTAGGRSRKTNGREHGVRVCVWGRGGHTTSGQASRRRWWVVCDATWQQLLYGSIRACRVRAAACGVTRRASAIRSASRCVARLWSYFNCGDTKRMDTHSRWHLLSAHNRPNPHKSDPIAANAHRAA